MNITSIAFLLFAAVLTAAYFILPRRCQWILLLAFSLYFYTRSGYEGLLLLLLTAAVSFITALWMEKENDSSRKKISALGSREEKAAQRELSKKKKRSIFILMCFVIFGIWVVTKYSGMILNAVQAMAPSADLSVARGRVERLIVPLGISFYTFNCAGYVIDISRKKYAAERNFFRFLLYVSFFPHIIQGPFSRFDRLGRTLFSTHSFDYDRMCGGLWRILYGYCQKLLVADKLSATVTAVMASPEKTPGIYLLAAVLGYGFQLYADFAGYMNIMCGICQILGIELEENFRQPYFAVSIQNYWQRWHMTLGHWYSDYVFYPASMGKTAQKIGRSARNRFGPGMGKLLPSYFAMVFVWTLTGLWHGARWTFVVWGWLNFAVIVFSMQSAGLYDRVKTILHIRDESLPWRIFQIIRTLLIVSILRVFYCAETVEGAMRYLRLLFTPNWGMVLHPKQILLTAWCAKPITLYYVCTGIIIIFIMDLIRENGWKIKAPAPLRAAVFAALFCVIVIGAGGGNASVGGFLYAQF